MKQVNNEYNPELLFNSNTNFEKLLLLHYDVEKTHFILLTTLGGYGSCLICPECNLRFAHSHKNRYDKHLLNHEQKEKVISFKEKPI